MYLLIKTNKCIILNEDNSMKFRSLLVSLVFDETDERINMLEEYLTFAKSHPKLFTNPPEGSFTILLEEEEIRRVEQFMGEKLKTKGLPSEWAHVGIAYRDQYVLLLRDAVRFADGSLG